MSHRCLQPNCLKISHLLPQFYTSSHHASITVAKTGLTHMPRNLTLIVTDGPNLSHTQPTLTLVT